MTRYPYHINIFYDADDDDYIANVSDLNMCRHLVIRLKMRYERF
jgi:hypothetical protein